MTSHATAQGVSPKTLLPRFVIRIRKGDRYLYYFRRRGERERLPDISDPAFAPAYSSKLVANGLLAEAARPMASQVFRQKVYFIEDTGTGAIKIGVAKWPRKRLTELQVGASAPLRIVAVVAGDEGLEKELHRRFAAHRTRGEWFTPDPSILAEIDALGASVPARRNYAR